MIKKRPWGPIGQLDVDSAGIRPYTDAMAFGGDHPTASRKFLILVNGGAMDLADIKN
jgi:hypothetical protein